VEITLVKAAGAGDRDRVWMGDAGAARRVAVHVVHDLPHLAVESAFGIADGLWGELAAGRHAEADRAAGPGILGGRSRGGSYPARRPECRRRSG
jgi:hypothetical protein